MKKDLKVVDYCRVCGSPSVMTREESLHEICVSCGCHIGLNDIDLESTREQRQEWLEKGPIWWSTFIEPPKNWDPIEQMKNIPPEWL